ncbi:hypothetical protein QR680_005964 [Steinernema hermaphroditum]|uniref:phytanoyl-CoA dioxygenase n=1 Tax=Steinernema hermaphroditum TaxID=289476 RepID=A0AA39HTX5_9BILA|nr:hypothetical protein QR680_005964 [Steinernema hermaphroditum]
MSPLDDFAPDVNWHLATGKVLPLEGKLFYRTNGYIVVRNCVSLSELDVYKKRFNAICRGENVPPGLSIVRDITLAHKGVRNDETTVTKIQDFQDDPVLFDYCKNPHIVDIVKDLIGNPTSTLVSMHTMLINKPPDTGALTSRHPMHQDLHYFPFRPEDYVCCAWTAMERVDRANGCLVVVPGTHRGKLLPHAYPKWEGGVNKAYLGIVDYDPSMPRTHVEMDAGDTVFFHPLLVHGSGANRTSGFRKAISCHYANDDWCHYVDVSGTTQQTAIDEVKDMARVRIRKMGLDSDIDELDYKILWQVRARAVNGTKSHL